MLRARRRGVHANTWPGFVDAMTGLLLVLMFVLTIFTVVQFTLRDQISGQQTRLDELAAEIVSLTDALGLSRSSEAALQEDLAAAEAEGERQATLIAALTQERDAQALRLSDAEARITGFEAQVAGLIAERDRARTQVAGLEAETARQADEAEALNLALASAREEIDAQAEQARLAAARRDALEALVRQLQNDTAEGGERLAEAEAALTEAEERRLVDAAAAEALRERLEGSEAELTAMTLRLEEERREAEETLTLLAAAEAARDDIDARLAAAILAQQQAEAGREEIDAQRLAALAGQESAEAERDELSARLAEALLAQQAAEEAATAAGGEEADLRARLARAMEQIAAAEAQADEAMTESERQAALLAAAQAELRDEEALSTEGQRQVAALNEQVAELRNQVGTLQALLDVAQEADEAAQVQIEALGQELNTALARVAQEERRRAEAETARAAAEEELRIAAEAEAARLAAEAADLETYRSEFFGKMRQLVEGREGVEVVGDRFVFSSEVLFPPGSDRLSPAGQAQIARVADLLREIAAEVPPGINWVIQVDGHTDSTPIRGGGRFADNWELSQARALSVVRQLSEIEGIPADRLSANGYGEFQPVDTSGTPAGEARNRRIEIKLTER